MKYKCTECNITFDNEGECLNLGMVGQCPECGTFEERNYGISCVVLNLVDKLTWFSKVPIGSSFLTYSRSGNGGGLQKMKKISNSSAEWIDENHINPKFKPEVINNIKPRCLVYFEVEGD